MKAEELRIGNLIEQPNGINEVFDLTNCEGEVGINTFLEHEIKPIPLTEEWHNKFGCEKNGFHSFEYKITERNKIIFSGDYIYLRDIQDMSNIESVGDDICVLWNNDEKIRGIFVHEWQNLYYALTGNELTTK